MVIYLKIFLHFEPAFDDMVCLRRISSLYSEKVTLVSILKAKKIPILCFNQKRSWMEELVFHKL